MILLIQVALGFTVALRNRRHPERAVLWLLLLLIIPLAGVIFYLLLGNYPLVKSRARDQMQPESSGFEHFEVQSFSQFARYRGETCQLEQLARVAGIDLTVDNDFTVLTNGHNMFSALLIALEQASSYIYMEYYIFRDDQIGGEVLAVLKRKAKSGVCVRMIFDGIGAHSLTKSFFQSLKREGIEVGHFSRLMFPFVTRRLNFRNHRKIVVIDGTIGFLGGINVGDEYLGRDPNYGFWRDTHLQLAGGCVDQLENLFRHDWSLATGQSSVGSASRTVLDGGEAAVFKSCEPVFSLVPRPVGNMIAQIIASGPNDEQAKTYNVILTAVNLAQKKLFIETAYLIPDVGLLQALKIKALSGLSIIIVVQGIPDHKLTYWATRSFYQELLQAGVRIFEYQKGTLHTKVLMVDDYLSYLGSANIDMRSFFVNFEVGALVYCEEINRRLQRDFYTDLRDSTELKFAEFERRSGYERLKEGTGRILAAVL